MKYLIIFFSLLVACNNNTRKTQTNNNNQYSEPLIKLNKSSVEMESDQIEGYIKRKGLNMKKNGTGLRYMVYEQGNGKKAENGLTAKVNYSVSLINGTEVYSTKESGPQGFLIGMDNVESGLHEGILYMNEGSKALLVIPSHLAHGLVGDMNKIPPKSTIIYDIELLELK
jgi:FKBP-type peptidyl-prolyl cis-trans isomerase FkpA